MSATLPSPRSSLPTQPSLEHLRKEAKQRLAKLRTTGASDGTGAFTIPQRPIRRRLQSLPPFVITRGGEYCFAPGLRALHWLAEPHTETAE